MTNRDMTDNAGGSFAAARPITMGDVRRWLGENAPGMSAATKTRVMKMLGGLPGGPEEFGLLPERQWPERWLKVFPAAKRGMGAATRTALAECVRWMRWERKARAMAAEAAKASAQRGEARFSRRQIKALSDMMELCGFESVNLHDVEYLFRAFSLGDGKEAGDGR